MRFTRHLFAIHLLAALPASAGAQRADVASLVAADRALAARAGGGIAALATGSTPDVVFLYPGAPVLRGREAMRGLLDSVAVASHDRLAWSAARAELSSDGLRGYTYGRGTRSTISDGRVDTRGMRYVAWWRRDDAGAWRPAAWLLIDERDREERDRTASTAAWPCLTPTPGVSIAAVASPNASAEVIATDSAFAQRSAAVGAAVAFAEYVAEDGVSIGATGVPACGKHAVGAQLAGAAPSDLVWSPIVGDASGDLGYTVGTATVRGARGVHYSKYLTVWKRQPDGMWRFVADAGNAAPSRLATFTAHR